MKSELTRFIENELELSALFLDSPQETIDLLKDKLKSIDDLEAEVERLLKYYRIKAWGKDTEQEYRSAKVFIDAEVGKSYPKFGIHYQLEGAPFVALAEYYIGKNHVYVGLGCHQGASEKRLSNIEEEFKHGPKKGDRKPEDWSSEKSGSELWYGWYEVEPEKAMAKFNELVKDLESTEAKMVLKSEAE